VNAATIVRGEKMSMTLQSIKMRGSYPVDSIIDFHLEAKVNQHAFVRYKGIISEKFALAAIERQTQGAVVIESVSAEIDTIFKGYPSQVKVTEKNGLFYLEVLCVSYTYFLDIKGNSRTFQDTDETYAEILETVYDCADNASIITTAGTKKSITAPIFQYEETDWQFTLRMAGRVGTVAVPNIKVDFPQVCYGVPKRRSNPQDLLGVVYEVGRNSCRCLNRKEWYLDATHDDFYYYTIKDVGQYDLGDTVVIDGKPLVVMEKKMRLEDGLIKSDYIFGRERGFAAPFIHNGDLHGLSLIGTVLDTTTEQIKLHFDIDDEQDKETAYWFPYVPQQGNVMYCMPQTGTKAVLKFRGECDDSGVIIHTYRTNGAECEEMSDYNKRYFTTEFGKRLAMLPDTLFCTGGSNLAELDDKKGASFETGKKVRIHANKNIRIRSKRKVNIDTPEHIYMTMPGTTSVIDMAGGEINALSENTVVHSTAINEQPYPAYDAMSSMRMARKLALMVAGTVAVETTTRK